MAKLFVDDAYDPVGAVRRAVAAMPAHASIRSGERVFVKPNLTYPRHQPGVTTSPQFIRAAIECFTDLGAHVTVGEGDGGYGSWSADLAFEGHGLRQLCARYGAELVNLSSMPARTVDLSYGGESFQLGLPAILLEETDAFVTLPVPKVHHATEYSGAVKNQWGCIPDMMRLRRHPVFPRLIWAINERIAPRLVLGDGQYMLDRTGPMWGDPIYMNRVIASDDILAFDVSVTTRYMGMKPESMPYLVLGRQSGRPWGAEQIEDRSTGPHHRFVLRRTPKDRVIAAAFPRRWLITLLWDSPFGRVAHKALHAVAGNPIARDRTVVRDGLQHQRHAS